MKLFFIFLRKSISLCRIIIVGGEIDLKKYQLVKQDNLKDCGVATLASIIKYYNGYVPMEKLREMTKTNKNGTTAYHIVETAKQLGFNSYGIKCELEDIDMDKITFPAIAYTIINNSYKHFVVIYDINFKTNKIIIADPMTKIKKITINEFKEIYQNVLIVLYPVKNILTENKNNKFTQVIKKLFVNKKILLFVFISVIYLILNLLCFIFLKELLNNKVHLIIIEFLFSFLLKAIVEFFRNKQIINFNFKTNLKLANEVFNQIIKLPYNFYRNRTTGDIISRFNDLEKIESMLLEIMLNLFININLIIMCGLFIFMINKYIFMIFIVLSIIYLIISLLFKRSINNNLEQEKISREKFNSDLIENISGFETIKGLNIESDSINKLSYSYKNYLRRIKISDNNYNIFLSLKNNITSFGNILIIFIGLILVDKKIIDFSELLIINLLLPYFLEPINYIFDQLKNIKEIFISIRKINELYYDENNDVTNEIVNKIEFKNVNYKNNMEEYILKNINLNIHSGEKIMIMGKSGSGKSTFLKLIKKYYHNENIYINDKHNTSNKNIIYVSQNEILFTDTLYNNITLGRNISDDEFRKVTKICHIDEIIKDKKLGYNLLLEENGFNISGGEKQRIILARTLLTSSSVLLLDESLSEVDINLERSILKEIIKEYREKTILLVTHRKNNLDLFDKLYMVADKKIEVIERNDSNV